MHSDAQHHEGEIPSMSISRRIKAVPYTAVRMYGFETELDLLVDAAASLGDTEPQGRRLPLDSFGGADHAIVRILLAAGAAAEFADGTLAKGDGLGRLLLLIGQARAAEGTLGSF